MAPLDSSRDAAQRYYENVRNKVKFLPNDLKEIVSADLVDSLQTDFSALSPAELEELKDDLSVLIEHPSVSDVEKEKFKILQLEIFSHYPQKLELLPQHGDFLVSRDDLAILLATNRYYNGINGVNMGIPAGKIQLQSGVEVEISSVKGYAKLISDYEVAIKSHDLGQQEKLDTELAERLILENEKWIQIDNDKLDSGDRNYKDFGTLVINSQKALRDLIHIGYDVEYVQLGGRNLLDATYQEEIKEKREAAKARPATERIAKVRQWAYGELLSENMTREKLETLIDHYQQRVDLESKYDVGNHEPLTIFKAAKEHFGIGEIHHVIRLREQKGGREDIEKPIGDLSLHLKGENPMILEVGEDFTDPGAIAKHGDKDVSDQISVEGSDAVDTSKEGIYEITYMIEVDDVDDEGKPIRKKQEKIRTIKVEKKEERELFEPDLELTLKGEKNITLQTGDEYDEDGWKATWWEKGKENSEEEDVSDEVKVTGSVNTDVAGTYVLTYTITKKYIDEKGEKHTKTRTAKRTIIVEEEFTPIPPRPEPILEEDDEISAVLSDVTASYEDMISREVENELKDERNNLSRAHPRKFIRLFNRGSKRKKMIKKRLAEYHEKGPYLQGVAVENEISAEADRHELELQNRIGKVEKKTELHLEPATATALNQLARDFLENRVGEVEFKRKFNDLITNDTTVRNNRRYFKADFVGSNILEKLKRTKKERALRKKIAGYIEAYTLGRDPRALDNIMPEINAFANEFKADPSRRKEIFGADGQFDKGKFENFINHTRAKEALGLNNLKIKLDLLGGGEGAYQINNKDRENRLYRFGHLMDKHPWITGGIMALATVGIGFLMPVFTTSMFATGLTTALTVGGTVGFKNFVAKWTHHTKEQNTHEKDLTRDFANVQRKMNQWRADLTQYGNRSRKGYKAKRQLELYEQSTQSTHLFGDTKQFADAILKGATATNLTPNQQNAFHFDVLKAYARLDFYRRQGHNFLKSEDVHQIEQDFYALEKALQLVAERNGGTSMTEIPAIIGATDPSTGRVINYNDLRADFEKDYAKAKRKFGQERALLATKWGVSTFLLATGTSIGSQYLFNTGMFSDKVSGATEATAGMEAHKEVDVKDLDLPSSANNITGAELVDGDNIVYKTGTEVFDKFNNASDTVRIRFGGSTDIHNVIPGGETFINQNYTAQVAEIQKLTDQLVANNLMTSTNRTELLASLDPNQWTNASQTFKNTVLHNTRALEGIEETLRAKLMSGSKAAIQAIYDPTLSTADHYRGLAVVIDATRDAVAANPGTLIPGTQRRSTPLVYLPNTFRRNRPEEEKRYSDDTIMVANNKQGEVEVLKIDTNKNPLSGAKFEVRDSEGNVIDNWETNDIPHKITGLDAGTYYLVETQAPAGHQKTNEVTELIVDEKGNVTRKNVDKSVVPIAPENPKQPEEIKEPEDEKPEEFKKEKKGGSESKENEKQDNIELVNVSPEKLKEIFKKYPNVGKLFKFLTEKKKIKRLTFDDSTFVSQNKGNGEISIGTKYQEGMWYQQDELFKTKTNDIARKLAHEMMHSVVAGNVREDSDIGNLYIVLKQLREYNSKKGLSMLVSKYPGTYKESNIQATEDMTELFAMYLIDSKHLKDYLTYLTTISNRESDRLGLKKLSPEVADAIYKQIDASLKDFVKDGNSQIDKKSDGNRRLTFNEKDEIVFADVSPEKSNKAKELAEKKVKISLPYTKQQPIEIDGQTFNVVKVHDRPVVVIDIAGITVPFYMTTGFGGKNLKPGWYPFFGFGEDGRINKTHREDMSNYYEKFVGSEVSVMWESIAEDLARTYGTDTKALEATKDVTSTEKPISAFADKFEDYLNKQLIVKPTRNDQSDTSSIVEQNIRDIGTKVLFSRNDKAQPAEKTEITSLQELKLKKEAGTIDKAEYRKQLKKLIAQSKVIKF